MGTDSDYDLSEIDPRLKAEIMETQMCPKCRSTKLIRDYDTIEVICIPCGFAVNRSNVNKELVEKIFNEKQKKKRVKPNTSLTYTIHNKNLTTVIEWHNRSNHEKITHSQNPQAYRLCKWQRHVRITSSTEHNLTHAMSEITKIANKLNLSKNVLETAANIYQSAIKEKLISGRSIQGMATAVLYLACRQCGVSKSLDDFACISSISKKEIGKHYRFLIKKFDYSMFPLQLNQCATKFFNKAALQKKIEEIIYKILRAAKISKLTAGRSPSGIAAAANYIALILVDEPKTHKEIAEIMQSTESTIKSRCKEFVNQLMFEISL